MRKSIFAAIVLIPFAASADSIELDSGSYWQIQQASNFETLCEGFIAECEVEPGVYNVINLTTGERQNGVVVASANEGGFSRPEIVTNTCDWTEAIPQITDTTTPDSVKSYGVLDCNVSCPVGKIVVATIQCTISSDAYASDFLISRYFPTAMIVSGNEANCRAGQDLFEGETPIETTVTVACQ